jgi:ATP synthase protein I
VADAGRTGPERELQRTVGAKEARKLRARRQGEWSVWFGLGMMGVVGWSVALPTLAGLALGLWLDHRWPGPVSWALTFLGLGVAAGCLNAWYWVRRESGAGPEEEPPETRPEEERP